MRAHADEVWVVTRTNNRRVIEADPMSKSPDLHFIYYDLPHWAIMLKRRAWFLPIYLILWQWGAYRLTEKHHRQNPFDRVYHITFATMLPGSFMGKLGIPFIIGPIGGGERAPFRLRRGMLVRNKIKELLRDAQIVFQRFSPLSRQAFAAADQIYVTTPDSMRLISPKFRHKTEVRLAISSDGLIQRKAVQPPARPRFVFIGRLLQWKGVHLAIRALAEARIIHPDATLTLIGDGPDRSHLQKIANMCGIPDAVLFAGYLSRQEVIESFGNFTALVFPSFHDSGGMVVLEAFTRGLPVVCLDLGGPGVMVNSSCGIVISTAHADEDQVVRGIANAMISLGQTSDVEKAQFAAGAFGRLNELSWAGLVTQIDSFKARNYIG